MQPPGQPVTILVLITGNIDFLPLSLSEEIGSDGQYAFNVQTLDDGVLFNLKSFTISLSYSIMGQMVLEDPFNIDVIIGTFLHVVDSNLNPNLLDQHC